MPLNMACITNGRLFIKANHPRRNTPTRVNSPMVGALGGADDACQLIILAMGRLNAISKPPTIVGPSATVT